MTDEKTLRRLLRECYELLNGNVSECIQETLIREIRAILDEEGQ
jgi:hypothetical protein